MELVCILSSIGAIITIVITMKLASKGNYWSIATALASVVLFAFSMFSLSVVTRSPKEVTVKTVQIDTVITTRNHISDTTYVIHYTK